MSSAYIPSLQVHDFLWNFVYVNEEEQVTYIAQSPEEHLRPRAEHTIPLHPTQLPVVAPSSNFLSTKWDTDWDLNQQQAYELELSERDLVESFA